jgi:hypothetical protein
MDWKRGFFRAWLLISVLWFIFALAITDFAGLHGAATKSAVVQVDQITMLDEGGGRWTATFDAQSMQLEAPEQVVQGSQDWDRMLVSIADVFSTEIATQNVIAAQRNRESMQTFFVLALAPFILLALGAAFGWVFQGFSGRSR